MTNTPEQEIKRKSAREGFSSKTRKTVILIALFWIFACVWWQLGWRPLIKVALGAGVIFSLIAIARKKIFKRLTYDMGVGATIGIGFSAAFVFWTGKHVLDVVIIVLAFAIFWFLSRRLKLRLGWVFCIATWVLLSLSTPLLDRRSENQDQARFEKITPRYPNLRIGVALSGGGFRAALLHAGVLSALDDLHIVPGNISSVSGGSITAAYYALGGKPADLLAAVQQGRFNLRRELASFQNTLRLPFPGQVPATKLRLFPWYEFSGTDVQANLLDRVLYMGKRFGDLDKPDAPKLMLCATDLPTGRAIGLTSNGTIEFRIFTPMEGTQPSPGVLGSLFKDAPKAIPSNYLSERFPRDERIATLVAASGGFPFAFEPVVRKVHFSPPHGYDNAQDHIYRFADGGITDNSGLTLMLTTQNLAKLAALNADLFDDETTRLVQDWQLDFTIESDASSFFSCKDPNEPGFDPARALDIVYSRVQMREPTFLRSEYKLRQLCIIAISPQTLVPDSCASTDIYVTDASREILSCLDEDGFRAVLFEYPNDVERLIEQRRKERSALQLNDASQTDDCDAGNRRTNADVDAHILIDKKIKEDLETFLTTDTLDDRISPDKAARLYNLGRYLLLLKFGEIQREATLRLHQKDTNAVIPCP